MGCLLFRFVSDMKVFLTFPQGMYQVVGEYLGSNYHWSASFDGNSSLFVKKRWIIPLRINQVYFIFTVLMFLVNFLKGGITHKFLDKKCLYRSLLSPSWAPR